MRRLALCSTVLLGASICWAQSPAAPVAFVGGGFANPFPLVVAWGQLLTLFVQPGAGYDPSAPPPNVSADFWNGSADETMPVLQVTQTNAGCNVPPSAGCTPLLAVTVQIPFEAPITPSPVANLLVPQSSVAVSVAGVKTSYFGVEPLRDHVHFVTACDVIVGGSPPSSTSRDLSCAPFVTHPDGRQVSALLPAVAGEELVAYVTGLGQTNPPLTTGQPAAQNSPTLATFTLDFNYRANALATQPGAVGAPVASPLFTGATQGFIGLYQINFIVPPPPAGIQPCVDFVVPAAIQAGNIVVSNLTVSVGSTFSFDGAGICVVPRGSS
jgi:uncharacterized protein (TIGR03437 family)